MIAKIKIFFPDIKPLKFYLIILISFFYGLSTIVTIYIVSTLVVTLSDGLSSSNLLMPIMILTDFLKSFFGLDDKLAQIILSLCSLTLMVTFGLTKIFFIAKISSEARHELSLRMLKKSLNINSIFLDSTHAGNIKSLILDETHQATVQLLKPTIEIVASLVFIFVLLLNLYFYEPKITILTSIIFGGIYIFNFLLTKSSIKRHGQLRFLSNKKRYQKVDDALSLKLLSNVLKTIDLFLERYSKDSKKMAKHQYLFDFLTAAPKIIIETIIFLALLAMISIGLSDANTKTDEISFVQTVIFFALTGLKMLPEFQKVYISVGLLKFGSTAQEGILNLLTSIKPPIFEQKINKKDNNNLIINFNCDACYTGNEKTLNKINLNIYEGDRLALRGKSGSGKTTFINALMGTIPININDKKGFFKADLKFGYLPQETSLFSSTILENIVMGRKFDHNKQNHIKLITASLFPEFQHENIDIFLNRVIEDVSTGLSVGQKQRIGLLRAIYEVPEILILDEFTSALDKKNEQIIINFVDKIEFCKTLIIVGHREESIKICNKFFNIENGNLIKY